MRNIILFLSVCLLFSCHSRNQSQQNVSSSDTLKHTDSFNGIFGGVTPCADCPGIYTIVNFNPDSTFEEYLNYMDRESHFKDSGTWIKKDSLITVTVNNEPPRYFKVENDSTVRMLDGDGKPVEGEIGKHFLLVRKDTLLQP